MWLYLSVVVNAFRLYRINIQLVTTVCTM